ncbi:MAG: FAD:protein FMN transferase [Anaerolineales bacterium]|nr:FAD:protein FMN transferase [Anaerolineales bacterium]
MSKKITRRDFLKIVVVGCAAGASLKVGLDALPTDKIISETRLLMGTVINLMVMAERKITREKAVEATFAELERQIAIFNHREPGSSVAMLNHTGKLAKPPKELVEVLVNALEISEKTGGAFDVTVKPLVDLYQQSQPALPTSEALGAVLKLVNYTKMNVSSEEVSFSQPGMTITLDGIAKGYIVDAAVAQLHNLGFENVFVEAGGDLMASGSKDEKKPWKVGVQSPRQAQMGLFASFSITDQAVATSGDYMQYFTKDMLNHHILNPRSGVSAPYLASATVVAPSCAQADAYATALMVMRPEDGLAVVNSASNIDALLIAKDMMEYRSSGFQNR